MEVILRYRFSSQFGISIYILVWNLIKIHSPIGPNQRATLGDDVMYEQSCKTKVYLQPQSIQ